MEAEPGGTLDGALEQPHQWGGPGRSAPGLPRTLRRVRSGGRAGHLRGPGGRSLGGRAQPHDGGPLGRGPDELVRARATGAEVAARHGGSGGHAALCAALDGFCAAVDEALAPGAAPSVGPRRVTSCWPPTRRSSRRCRTPSSFRASAPACEPLLARRSGPGGRAGAAMIDRDRRRVGRLEPLLEARADEVAAVAGLAPRSPARSWRACRPGSGRRRRRWRRRPGGDGPRAHRPRTEPRGRAPGLRDRVPRLVRDDRDAKKRLRRQREISFLRAHHRAGAPGRGRSRARAREALVRPAAEDIRAPREPLSVGILFAAPTEVPARKIEKDIPSGAHAAP